MQNIGLAVPALVRVLAEGGDYSGPQKEAVKALLHHARRSPPNLDVVRRGVSAATLDDRRKKAKRFRKSNYVN